MLVLKQLQELLSVVECLLFVCLCLMDGCLCCQAANRGDSSGRTGGQLSGFRLIQLHVSED